MDQRSSRAMAAEASKQIAELSKRRATMLFERAEFYDRVRDNPEAALIAYQHPVMLELDDSMTALRAAVEPLLAGGKARLAAAETLVVAD